MDLCQVKSLSGLQYADQLATSADLAPRTMPEEVASNLRALDKTIWLPLGRRDPDTDLDFDESIIQAFARIAKLRMLEHLSIAIERERYRDGLPIKLYTFAQERVKRLRLMGIDLDGAHLVRLMSKNSKTLEVVYLHFTSLCSGTYQEIFESLIMCKKLKEIDLDYCGYEWSILQTQQVTRPDVSEHSFHKNHAFCRPLQSARWEDSHSLAALLRHVKTWGPLLLRNSRDDLTSLSYLRPVIDVVNGEADIGDMLPGSSWKACQFFPGWTYTDTRGGYSWTWFEVEQVKAGRKRSQSVDSRWVSGFCWEQWRPTKDATIPEQDLVWIDLATRRKDDQQNPENTELWRGWVET